ncbi:unnamed protein product, partial [Ectocarpus sp. 8 AP-2014]
MMMSVFLSPRKRAIEETHTIKNNILATPPTPTAVITTASATTTTPTVLYYNTTTASKVCPHRVPFKQRTEPIFWSFAFSAPHRVACMRCQPCKRVVVDLAGAARPSLD